MLCFLRTIPSQVSGLQSYKISSGVHICKKFLFVREKNMQDICFCHAKPHPKLLNKVADMSGIAPEIV